LERGKLGEVIVTKDGFMLLNDSICMTAGRKIIRELSTLFNTDYLDALSSMGIVILEHFKDRLEEVV